MSARDERIPHPRSVQELRRQLELEQAAEPFLLFRDAEGELDFHPLDARSAPVVIGRSDELEVSLDWDAGVSRVHCALEPVGPDWTVTDDGISRNGTFVNAERVQGRRRLKDGDVLAVGQTSLVFRSPAGTGAGQTVVITQSGPVSLSEMQRKVLIALCRPYAPGREVAAPATNAQIAEELHLSLEGVKSHMKALFEKLDAGERPQGQKRAYVVEQAFRLGLVTHRDL